MGIRFDKEKITKENIIDFYKRFFDEEHFELEVISEKIVEGDKNKGKLVGQNLFEEIQNHPEEDKVVFYYRSKLN